MVDRAGRGGREQRGRDLGDRARPRRRRTAHRRWRTPSSSTTSIPAARSAIAASRAPGRAARVVEQADDRARVHARSPGAAGSGPPWGRSASARAAARRRPGRTARGAAGRRSRAGCARSRAGHPVGLLVDVDRRVRVLAQRPVGAPRRQRPGGPPIAVVGLVAGLLGREVEPDDVRRVAGDQALAHVAGSMTSYGGATTRPRSPTADGS